MNGSSQKDFSVFVPLELENKIFLIQRVVFGVSCVLHVPALLCLLKETPPNQAMIKPYLITCQISVILADSYISVLFEPIPLAEIFGGYCRGVFCHWVGVQKATGTYIFLGAGVALSTGACIIERHQAMMPATNVWKLKKVTKFVCFLFALLACILPTTAFTVYPFSLEQMDRSMNESIYELAWIRKRGEYMKAPENLFIHVIAWMAFTIICVIIGVVNIPFWHMFYVLNRENNTSERTKSLIRLSLRRLYAQMNAPILFLAIPIDIFFLQACTRCFPFLFALIAPFTLCFHPIVHNLILLLIIPTYRNAIADALSFWKWRRKICIYFESIRQVASNYSIRPFGRNYIHSRANVNSG